MNRPDVERLTAIARSITEKIPADLKIIELGEWIFHLEAEIRNLQSKVYLRQELLNQGFEDRDALKAENTVLQTELKQVREFLWLNHGHDGIYGDDGEMQCGQCMPHWDYKREDIQPLMGIFLFQIDALRAENERLQFENYVLRAELKNPI